MDKLSNLGKNWSGCASLLSVIIGIAALLGVGTYFYNQVWQSKVLTYTLLPSYDLEDQAFSGIVIENRGQVTLTNVQVIVTDLDETIFKLTMPGAHEPAVATSGGEGFKNVTIEMKRFSPGASLPIYVMTDGIVNLEDGKTFFISSDQVRATPSSQQDKRAVYMGTITGFLATITLYIIVNIYEFNRYNKKLPKVKDAFPR